MRVGDTEITEKQMFAFSFLFCGLNFYLTSTATFFHKYHLFKMPHFLQELSFGRAKEQVDPLFFFKVKDVSSPLLHVLLQGSHFSQGSDTYRLPMVLCCSDHPEISAVKRGDVCCWPQFHGPQN